MLGSILFFGGIILAVIGGIMIIRFDGSIKRAVICGLMILIGASAGFAGYHIRETQPTEYNVVEVISVNSNDSQYRITLKAGVESTIIYCTPEKAEKFKQGETVSLTKAELNTYR